jgi:GNAT superfamily N-acetyltransferase
VRCLSNPDPQGVPSEQRGWDLQLEIDDAPGPEDIGALVAGLAAYNAVHAGGERPRPIGVFARRGGQIVGGADGRTFMGWLYVAHLWVADHQRGTGLGSRVLTSIEQAALARGCRAVWLDTLSFQAPGFYEKLGYAEFARSADPSTGHARHFFSKEL